VYRAFRTAGLLFVKTWYHKGDVGKIKSIRRKHINLSALIYLINRETVVLHCAGLDFLAIYSHNKYRYVDEIIEFVTLTKTCQCSDAENK
jgi:hypothetical protein